MVLRNVLVIIICFVIKVNDFAQTDSTLILKKIDSVLDAQVKPNSLIIKQDSVTKLADKQPSVIGDSLNKDSLAINQHLDSLKKKKRGKFGIALGLAINPYPNNLAYSYFLNEDKSANAFIDFKATPQINFLYIFKNNLIINIEGWEQSGNNVMDNIDGGNSLTVTHFSGSLTHLIKVITTDKYTIAPYAGLRFSNSTKELSYFIKYNNLDSSTVPPHLDSNQYSFSYSESSSLNLMQVPLGITFMSKKIIADLGVTLNVYGVAQGSWQSANKELDTSYVNGNYSKTFALANSLFAKIFKSSKIKNTANIPWIGEIYFKMGYLFQSNPNKKYRRKIVYYEDI